MIAHLGKYQILGIIGRGGMSTVYRAFDPVLARHVALKVVSAEGELSAEQKARLLREGKACAQLTHPNIISVHDLGEDAGRFFIVMELLQGEDLKRFIGTHATLSLAEKLSLMIQACDGLHYAHQKGIVHRDIKPGNMFVLPDCRLKILDFGLAYLTTGESNLTQTGQIVGTLAYMAPERFRGLDDYRVDIFAVGAVCYELLTGRRAFTGENAVQLLEMIRSAEPPPLTSVDPSLPPELAAAVEVALRKDPAARFADLAVMRTALDKVRQRLLGAGEASTRVAPLSSSADAGPTAGALDTIPPSPLAASNPRPRTAALVGRFGAQFRRFRLAISVSFTVTVVVALYFVGPAVYNIGERLPPETTVSQSSPPPVMSPPAPTSAPPPPTSEAEGRAHRTSVDAQTESARVAALQRQNAEQAARKRAESERVVILQRQRAEAESERVAALRRQNAEQALFEMSRAKDEADKSEAFFWTPQLLAGAAAKESDGQAAIGRQDWDVAVQRFREAQTEYRKAAAESTRLAGSPPATATPPPSDDGRKRRPLTLPAF